jgi:hypothetical protein
VPSCRPSPVSGSPARTGDPAQAHRITFSIGGTPTYAMVALPASAPAGIVMYGHGYNEWAAEDYDVAQIVSFAQAGAIAIGPDFRGTIDPPDLTNDDLSSRGLPVANGALDMAAIAEATLRQCPVTTVISSGGSMGGSISGFAVTLNERRPDGTPLFDDWVGISPETDLAPDWAGALALSPLTSYYVDVHHDIEAEAGGTPASAPGGYVARSLIFDAAEMKAAGLRGAVITHSAADLDITPEQPTLMVAGLRAEGIPTELMIDTTAAPGENDSSFDNFLLGDPLYLTGIDKHYQQLLAGHEGPYLRDDASAVVASLLHGGRVSDAEITVQTTTQVAQLGVASLP